RLRLVVAGHLQLPAPPILDLDTGGLSELRHEFVVQRQARHGQREERPRPGRLGQRREHPGRGAARAETRLPLLHYRDLQTPARQLPRYGATDQATTYDDDVRYNSLSHGYRSILACKNP